jgi:tetratricopeptide (TPR) repeat protein
VCRLFFLRSILLSLFVGAAAPYGVSGQDVFTEGDRLHTAGLVDEAVTAYLRALFELKETAAASGLCARIARCYTELGRTGRAVLFCNQAITAAAGDDERRERLFQRVEVLLAGGRYQAAARDLEALEALTSAPGHRARRRFLEGVLSLYLHDWERAYIHLSLYFALTDTYPADTEIRVLKLLSFARRMWTPDPQAAAVLSYIVPGLGQMYAGNVPTGLNSLLVTGGAATLVGLAVVSGDWPDAIALTYFVFIRFYLGGPYHADRISREKAEDRGGAVLRAIVGMLLR